MMKNRFYAVLISLMIPIVLLAQHATFYDHPINGPLSKFDKMLLQEEGFEVSGTKNNSGSGFNSYTGKFIGLPCLLFVYYDISSKNVYRVRVMFPYKTEEAALEWLEKIAEPIMMYYELDIARTMHGDYPSIEGFIMAKEGYMKDIGWMELFVAKNGNQYGVLFDIYDLANSKKYGKLPEKTKSFR